MYILRKMELNDFDFGCKRFQELLQKQSDCVDNWNRTVLMYLCRHNPQLLSHSLAIELVQRLGMKIDKRRYSVLISIFYGNAHLADFSQIDFKLLWEIEKGIEVHFLKFFVRQKPELRELVVLEVPEAAAFYE